VSRRVALAAVLLVAFAAAAGGAEAPVTQLMPDVTFQRLVQLTPHGPVVVDVITAPRPGGLYTLAPVLAGGLVGGGREPLTEIEHDASATATVAGINGDLTTAKGLPSGIVLQNGTLVHSAASGRSSIGVDSGGTLHVKRFGFVGTWKGSGQRRPLAGVNQPPKSGQVVLFTPAWGATTPFVAGSTEAVLDPFPSTAVDADLTAPVTSQASGGGTPIPPDGAVLMSVGSPPLTAEAAEGQSVTVRLILPSDWTGVVTAVGGGPVLVKNGKPVFHTGEDFDAAALATRDARAAVGQLADGRIVLVAVDGGQPGYSAGVSSFELARTMAGLGAVTAAALNYGATVSAAFDGQLLDRPRTAGGGKVKEALLVQYAGVYAPPPSVPALDKGDVAAGEQLAYRIVRPSTVTATVIAPDGAQQTVDSGSRQPGTYSFTWPAVDAEGTWHWRVSATDDLGRQSQVDETFTYDLTLSALTLSPRRPSTAAAGVTASFRLSRPATAALDIETRNGTVVRSLPAQDLPAGAASLRWDGTLDGAAKAPPGSYVAHVTATSAIGQMALAAPFTLHG
jgi:hypothetical protein